MRFIDLTGNRYGRLTVLYREDFIKKDGKHETAYICKCDCGNERKVLAYNLKNGHTVSCGCQSLERRTAARTTHHETRTRLYRIWNKAKSRCTNPKDERYEMYGGRGITFCEEWMFYEPFRDWALNNGYADNLSIDRIDNNKGYAPENCRWTTPKVQSNNTRRNRRIECRGECLTLAEWGNRVGIRPGTIAFRLESGWSVEDAIFKPVRSRSCN